MHAEGRHQPKGQNFLHLSQSTAQDPRAICTSMPNEVQVMGLGDQAC